MIDYSVIKLENTINSGQVFLWTKQKEFWYGINGQDILKINNLGKITSHSKKKYDFFRNIDDIEKIIKSISKDKKKIANATIQEIQNCGVGYRAKFIIDAAKMVESRQIDFDQLKKSNYQNAKETILTVPGIGNKVADCILLF